MASEKLPPHRTDPVIKILDTPEFKSIFTPELIAISNLFNKYNYELRIAGGAVRDILMGMMPKDLDFATTATPAEMKNMFTKEEIRMINTNGERHGTITSRINDKENFEVTTLREDVVTDGRHAEVVFTTDWLLDASRRDLTINSMFLDLDGKVYDYFYGYDDLKKKRIAFVGDPARRICEDFLRILRYFRFYGRISDVPDNHDKEIIDAMKTNIEGLQIISGERIWSELNKILQGNHHRELMKKMIEVGCGKYMDLPENLNIDHFDEVCLRAQKNNVKLRSISYLCALFNTEEHVLRCFSRLRFTNFEKNLALYIVLHRNLERNDELLKIYRKSLLFYTGKAGEMKEFIIETMKYRGDLDMIEEFENWEQRFPITSSMVIPHVKDKQHIGVIIKYLKGIWIDNNCEISVEKLMSYIPELTEKAEEVVNEMMQKRKKFKKDKKKSVAN